MAGLVVPAVLIPAIGSVDKGAERPDDLTRRYIVGRLLDARLGLVVSRALPSLGPSCGVKL